MSATEVQQRILEGQRKLMEAQIQLGTLFAEGSANADEAAILANWEEVSTAINGLLQSVSTFLHKIG